MQQIPLPQTITVNQTDTPHRAEVIVSPCYPGYGTTLGNALRRVLLSSLPGAAATAVKIKGVDHEFSTIAGIKEDVVEIILNIKGIRFVLHGEEPVELQLKKKGEGPITAADFDKSTAVEVLNPEHVIATSTDKSTDLQLRVIVQPGRGYIPVEEREDEKLDIGYIAIDAIYTPVRSVNFRTEDVRVGKMTNYDKLLLDITTDGTTTPEAAFRLAAHILVQQFGRLTEADAPVLEVTEEPSSESSEEMAPETSPEQAAE
jgi:DNA-directed RNA polymerase subunit alpha